MNQGSTGKSSNKSESVLELLVQTSKVITSEVDLEKLVQRITDLGTELTQAAFGAFFYNVTNPSGEKYVLYTISGVPREAFSKFPMPRNTAIFNPTFVGEGTRRYDDVTAQPHFGKSAPYYGMPKGHLPVRSYLAVPVISSFDNEVLGGLFFGHPEVGVFTEESERLIEGIAAQAAIAMANARLFEEKNQSERKLVEQHTLIHTIASNTRHALLMTDENQVCTYMNPAAELMTGFTLAEIATHPLNELLYRNGTDLKGKPKSTTFIQALQTASQTTGEDIFIHKAGHPYSVAFTASPILEDGVIKGTVIEVRDTTEEKRQAEERKQKELDAKRDLEQRVKERTAELEKINYELLQFTSVASHDLKEPLRKVSIFAKLLQEQSEGRLDPVMTKYLDNILKASARMTFLIDDLLSFSRFSQDNTPRDTVSLNNVLAQIISDLEISISEKNARVDYHDLPVVNGIALQLGQVFQNLISNSLKFSHPGRNPHIRITALQAERGGKPIHRITYSDNGIGFDNGHAQKIFEIFHRLHTRDDYEGTGIGLAIVKKIVTLHGGDITAQGDPGVGAVFEITLPA